MDPVSAIGLASSILTFVDIGYKVVTGTLEIAQTGRAPHTQHIDAVARNLKDALEEFTKNVPANPSVPEKALGEVSDSCHGLLEKELLPLLEGFKAQASKHRISWDGFKAVIRQMRSESELQKLRTNLDNYRSQAVLHLVTILNDRQLATQIQLGNFMGQTRKDLRSITEISEKAWTVLNKLEQAQIDQLSTTQPIPGTDQPLPEQKAVLEKLAIQCKEVKDALDHLKAGISQKTPETRILEYISFGNPMFQRQEDVTRADEATFRWFVEGVSSEDGDGSELMHSETSSGKVASRGLHVGELKAEAASRFQKWLRSGSGVFHISGKAGSGKSTLMKLIVSTDRTHELLREWAGGEQLLLARFFFWAHGDKLQKSLEGLQRSILFEILIHQPDLVKKVFNEAYPIVANNNSDSLINSILFTTASFQKAFEQLLLLPVDPRYRICLFIDGLDEYGAKSISGSLPEAKRGDLAQRLVKWARNDRVKILASSRPHPEFIQNFQEDQRVHLHQLTHDDMIEFGHHLFKKHWAFKFPGVKDRYEELVRKVVNASGGVFLWTGLIIRRLLISLARYDSFESLEKQLEATPEDLNLLYKKLFSEINEVDRHKAMMMMLLVSEERKYLGNLVHPGGVNAMAISWLERLEDTEFPANQPFVVYTEDEIEEKRKLADTRVNAYTRGLLEVTTHIPESESHHQRPPYLRHTLQFFHRTALEYVAARNLAQNIQDSSPNLFNLEFYTRLSLAELHFGSLYTEDTTWSHPFDRYPRILREYLCIPKPCQSLIKAHRDAFEAQARYGAWRNKRIGLNGFGQFATLNAADQSTSFDHWVANEVQEAYAAQYLTERIEDLPDLIHPRDGLSLLLSAACRQPGEDLVFFRLHRVKMILELDADLHHHTRLKLEKSKRLMELSVWQAWCLYYVTAILNPWPVHPGYKDFDMSQILELFLEAGVDSDCYILMRENRPPSAETSTDRSDGGISGDSETEGDSQSDKPAQQQMTKRPHTDLWTPADKWVRLHSRGRRFNTAYVVSLADFIRQAKPANYEQLERLLSKDNRTHELSTTMLSEIEAELATSQHPEFKFPTVRPVDLNHFFADHKLEELLVYWIRWKDATVPGFLELRLY